LDQDLVVDCGADFTVAITFVDSTTNAAIPLSSPKCDVRSDDYSGSDLLLSPAVSVAGNVVTVTITETASLAVSPQRAYYDVFATRSDTGQEVRLAFGRVTFRANVTALP
jgi:hypothetical protein